MIPTSKAPIRFTPAWAEGQPDAPAYLIRPGDVIERETLEAELAGQYGAGRVYDFELLAAFAAGVEVLLADDPERMRLVELATAERDGEPLPAEDRQALRHAKDVMAEHWPEFRALTKQLALRNHLAPVLAFRRFCTGWENVDAAFAKGPDGMVTADALKGVPPLELKLAGHRAYDLLYAGGEEKNSSPPSKSDAAPRISRSGGRSRAAGRSRAKNGRKIPA